MQGFNKVKSETKINKDIDKSKPNIDRILETYKSSHYWHDIFFLHNYLLYFI